MSTTLLDSFTEHGNNPFELPHIHVCTSLDELDALPDPKVVLTSLNGLEVLVFVGLCVMLLLVVGCCGGGGGVF